MIKKYTQNLLSFKILILLFFIIMPLQRIMADGGMIAQDYVDGDIYEPSQTALIAYDNDYEDLYLKVNYEGNTNDFVWIIPTPSFPKTASTAKDIFEELSALTNIDEQQSYQKSNDSLGLANGGISGNVIVHSQQTIGVYEVTVLSAAGVDGLYDWLNDNGYEVKANVKNVLDWYVKKEWYFTAVRIDGKARIDAALEAYLKFDRSVTKDNLSDKLSHLFIDSIVEHNYEKAKQAISIFNILMPQYNLYFNEPLETEEKFAIFADQYQEDEQIDADSRENEYEKLAQIVDYYISKSNPDSLYKYSEYLEPLKLSFNTPTIVYPLKISQISTKVPTDPKESLKTNEVLLYILADKKLYAPDFTIEYAQKVNQASLEESAKHLYSDNLESLKKIINDKEYFLTKIRRSFAKVEMDEDVYFTNDEVEAPDKIKKYNEALARDEKRISDIKQLMVANELYYNDNNKYPDSIISGEPLKSEGGTIYMSVVPSDPGAGNKAYGYQSLSNGTNYRLSFELEVGTKQFGYGACTADNSGITCSSDYAQEPQVPLSESYSLSSAYDARSGVLKGSAMSDRLKGRIILKVEDQGKAYYINPITHYMYYLGRPADAFSVMREQGVGIKNSDLYKIPVGIDGKSGNDTDNDGLLDSLEDALGLDKLNKDTDNDGYSDGDELKNGYNPWGAGKQSLDNNFAQAQAGKIFLQVENNGEAWYVNPTDAKRYFLGRPADSFRIMRLLSLGISNADFNSLQQ